MTQAAKKNYAPALMKYVGILTTGPDQINASQKEIKAIASNFT